VAEAKVAEMKCARSLNTKWWGNIKEICSESSGYREEYMGYEALTTSKLLPSFSGSRVKNSYILNCNFLQETNPCSLFEF
jgi:hypothetical protein